MTGDVLQWFGIFLSLFLIYYGYRYQFSKAPLEKQLYSAYLPMFRILEPHLYKKIEDIGFIEFNKLIDELLEIIDRSYELIEPNIIHWTNLLKKGLDNQKLDFELLNGGFNYLCKIVDREFEKTRSKMFLPTRNIYYRLNNNQYATKEGAVLAFVWTLIPQILAFCGIAYLYYTFIKFTE